MIDELYGPPRGWVGPPEVIDPFHAGITLSSDGVGIINPPSDALPCVVDAAGGLVGFAILARPGFEITPPQGAFEMAPMVASALLSVLSSGR